ncbi:hypothetical protein [Nocardioides gilvus]|uniref:hypothetical protein n=1 Tax=Nocardioides gilvus TaxID=1735589 RepID=UPI000D74214A|nr:hypothetical protein [Nocardioides gilvus]
MRGREWRAVLASLVLASLVLASAGVCTVALGAAAVPAVVAQTGTPAPSPSEAPQESGVRRVDDAVFAWSISQQSNAQSHNPLTNNFLSAGAADPGRGGMVLSSRRWSAQTDHVEIQKVDAAGTWRQATWEGLGTDANGTPIGLYGPFSGHRVRITHGSGTLDPGNDDATVQWRGTFTVVYYGGNTVFTLTDPKLTVTGGVGRLTATGGGWASDRFDPTVWEAVEPREVPVVELRDVDVTETGLEVTPGYRGVPVTGPESQVRSGADWGSFPQEFVSFLEPMGASQFWYSTGLQSDWTKLPQPIAVGWQGAEPESPRSTTPAPTQTPQNPVKTAPPVSTARPTPAPSSTSAPPPSKQPDVPVLARADSAQPPPAPSSGNLPPGGGSDELLGQAASPLQVSSVASEAAPPATPQTLSTAWAVGGALLLAAALLLLVPTAPRRPRPDRL